MKTIVYFNGSYIEYHQASIPLATHALHYGTGCFEGIRGYWNEEQQTLFLFRLRDHYRRLANSCATFHMTLPMHVNELCTMTIELVRRNNVRENVYIRTLVYKAEESIAQFNLDKLADGFAVCLFPLGHYLNVSRGIAAMTSRWLRVDARMIPPCAKPTGIYLNTCLAKTEAETRGADEAIFLNADGTVAEGSAENIFLVKKGTLFTPSSDQNILDGITRRTIIEIARSELSMETVERPIQKKELFEADEVFLTGSGAEVVGVSEIDGRLVKGGAIGSVTGTLQARYFTIVGGNDRRYARWLTSVAP